MNEPQLNLPEEPALSKDEEERVDIGPVGGAMIGVANGVWAVVGLFFWVPLLVRALLLSVVRVVHGAVTRQPPTYLKAFISRESSFYLAGFWTRRQLRQSGVQRKYSLKLKRFAGELVWTAIFYLALVRLLSADLFETLWRPVRELGLGLWSQLKALAAAGASWIPEQLPSLIDSGYPEWIIVILVILLALASGIAFGLALRLRKRDSRWPI